MKRATKAERGIEALHKAYVTPKPREDERDDDSRKAPNLRALAKRFGVSFRDADHAEIVEDWEAERLHNEAMAWKQRCFPDYPEDLIGFTRAYATGHYGHLCGTFEGFQLAMAWGRRCWWDWGPDVARWRAHLDHKAASEAYDAARASETRRAA